MRSLLVVLITVFATALLAQDQTSAAASETQPSTTVNFIARWGQNLSHPRVTSLRQFEGWLTYGKWVPVDAGCIDFGGSVYHECYVGGGRTIIDRKKFILVPVVLFLQALGPDGNSASYIQPFLTLIVQPADKWSSEVQYLLYAPLNREATLQHLLEHAKFEYAFAPRWKLGGGYAMFKFGHEPTNHKPLFTITRSTQQRGDWELWVQGLLPEDGIRLQLRWFYSRAMK